MNNIDPDKYNDVNYLSTLLYDVLYNKKTDRKLIVNDVKISDIKMSNIKKDYSGEQYRNLINNVFNRDISFVEKSIKKYIFKINDIDNHVDLVLKISENPKELNNSDNMNKVMTYLMSGLVINKKTKHILMNVFNFDVKTEDISRFIEKITDNEEVINALSKKNHTVSVEIREHYFKMDTLQNVLNDNSMEITDNDVKIIIFQVLHTLAIIQNRYPTFRHNNLDLKNIYCYLKEKKSNSYEYYLDDIKYIVPNIGMDIKISNFDESIIVGEIDNESIIDSLKAKDNTYDCKIFLDSLLKINKLSNEIKIFIKDIMSNLSHPKKLIFGNSSFGSFKSKQDLSEVSYEDEPKIKKSTLTEMDSEVSVDGKEEKKYTLNRSYYGLYVPKMVWRSMENFSTNALAFVASDSFYDEQDYIRDKNTFLNEIYGAK